MARDPFSVLRVLAGSDPKVFAEEIKRFGLKVVGFKSTDPLKTRVQSESVAAIASTITEDVDTDKDLHPATVRAMQIAEDYGYIVKVLEEMFGDEDDEGAVATKPAVAPPKPKPKPGTAPPKERPKRRQPWNPPRPAEEPTPKACRG